MNEYYKKMKYILILIIITYINSSNYLSFIKKKQMNNQHQPTIECPICFEEINSSNMVNTDCGHSFHCTCLMNSISHNILSCPICRNTLVNESTSDTDQSSLYDDESIYSDEIEDDDDVYINLNTPYVRHLFDEDRSQFPALPTLGYITDQLGEYNIERRHLVASILSSDHSEFDGNINMEEIDNQVFSAIRNIIENFYIPNNHVSEHHNNNNDYHYDNINEITYYNVNDNGEDDNGRDNRVPQNTLVNDIECILNHRVF